MRRQESNNLRNVCIKTKQSTKMNNVVNKLHEQKETQISVVKYWESLLGRKVGSFEQFGENGIQHFRKKDILLT